MSFIYGGGFLAPFHTAQVFIEAIHCRLPLPFLSCPTSIRIMDWKLKNNAILLHYSLELSLRNVTAPSSMVLQNIHSLSLLFCVSYGIPYAITIEVEFWHCTICCVVYSCLLLYFNFFMVLECINFML